jgi:site-specific recombinase XerD
MLEHPTSNLGGELVQRYEKWLLVQQYAAQTRFRYVTCVRNFLRFLAPRSALATTFADIQAYLGECAQKGFLYNKLRDELHGLRGFFDFLNLGGLMNWVPPRMVRPRSFKREIPRFLGLRTSLPHV